MKNTWRFTGRELEYAKEVLGSGFGSGTSGDMNNRFEKAFAKKMGVPHAVTFNSGTSTLHGALYAAGVGYGDEVIIPPLTVISNFSVILAQNAVPVFADINPDTFNIDPGEISKKITQRTKAIMPVPLFGLPCDYDPIIELATKHNLVIINDAAQALMAEYKGRSISQICPITNYSLENSKHITCGDGGIIISTGEKYAEAMRKFGSLGYAVLNATDGRIRSNKDIFQDPNYSRHDEHGLNYRMPEIAAALGLAQTERLDGFVETRIKIASMYDDIVRNCSYITPQFIPEGYKSTYWSYAARYHHHDVSWYDFRHKYAEFGGDGIYAAWMLIYLEKLVTSGQWKNVCPPLYENIEYPKGLCPKAELVQPQLMQFVNNYGTIEEAEPKVEALQRTIEYFK